MKYTFYRITHPIYQEINYVGSCKNLTSRKQQHKESCFNEKSKTYNLKLYKFIRENNILWTNLKFEILLQCDTNIHLKLEQMFINQYDSITNGNNNMNAYNPNYQITREQTEKRKNYRENYRENNQDYFKQKKQTEEYKNKQKIYRQKKVKCEICNLEMNRNSLTRHKKRKH